MEGDSTNMSVGNPGRTLPSPQPFEEHSTIRIVGQIWSLGEWERSAVRRTVVNGTFT